MAAQWHISVYSRQRSTSVAFGESEADIDRAALTESGFMSTRPGPATGGRRAPLFIAVRATDPPQHLLYLVRDPWPWGKPHEAAGIHHPCRRRYSRVAARGTRAAGHEGLSHWHAGDDIAN